MEAQYKTAKPDVTVIGLLMASDGTAIKKRQGAHPVYISIGNLSPRVRASPHGWRVAGFLPQLNPDKMSQVDGGQQAQKFTLQRRRRQVHNQATHLIIESLIRHEQEGGLTLMCGDGICRRILFRFSAYITDRMEHETVCLAPAHTCWQCNTPARHKDSIAKSTPPYAVLKTASKLRQEVLTACEEGIYGDREEWKKIAQVPKAILEVNEAGSLDVVSRERYLHCARTIGVYPDPNLWHTIPGVDIYQQCRDDEMHQFRAGMMHHLFTASITAFEGMVEDGVATQAHREGKSISVTVVMRRLWETLSSRLLRSETGLSKYVAKTFMRAYETKNARKEYAYRWGLTGAETETLFMVLPLCLEGLVAEVMGVHNAPWDRTSSIVVALSNFMEWYMAVKREDLTDKQVRDACRHLYLQKFEC
jgi:hypothetical protein